jgi:hypothetical protein
MNHKLIIKTIGRIELLLGLTTCLGLIIHSALSISQKPLPVFIFVLLSSIASTSIGVGLLNHKDLARKTLIFFSGYIVLTKIMIFTNLIQFNGEIITFIPSILKNYVSLLYHSLLIIFFTQSKTQEYFA